MVCTLSGIATSFKLKHCKNVLDGISFIPSGSVTFSRPGRCATKLLLPSNTFFSLLSIFIFNTLSEV